VALSHLDREAVLRQLGSSKDGLDAGDIAALHAGGYVVGYLGGLTLLRLRFPPRTAYAARCRTSVVEIAGRSHRYLAAKTRLLINFLAFHFWRPAEAGRFLNREKQARHNRNALKCGRAPCRSQDVRKGQPCCRLMG
jgi:hypothetical protein